MAFRYRNSFGAAALLMSLAAGMPVRAADEGSAPAPYVQMSLGRVHETSPTETGTAMDLHGSSSGVNLRAIAGLQFGPHLGAELAYFRLPESHVDTGTGTATYKGSTYALSLTGTAPIAGKVSLMGRLGYARSDTDVSVPSTSYRSSSRRDQFVWGAGAHYAITSRIDATLDYDDLGAIGKYAQGSSVRASVISLGVRFNF